MNRERIAFVATALIAVAAVVSWIVLRFGPNDSGVAIREIADEVAFGRSVTGPPNVDAEDAVSTVADGRVERKPSRAADEQGAKEPHVSFASMLRVQLVPPVGRNLSSALVAFRGVPDGLEVSAATAAGQSVVELAVSPCLKPGKGDNFIGLLEVDAAHCAQYIRWMTPADAAGMEVIEWVVQLELAHGVDVVVVDQLGRPASGAVVLASCAAALAQFGATADWRVEADSNGLAALRGLARGDWIIHAGQWKDWESSQRLAVQPNSVDSSPTEIVLTVARWPLEDYASGAIGLPAGWSDDVYLQDCTLPERSYPVHGNEFYVRTPRFDRRTLRVVDRHGGRSSQSFQIVGGEHGTQIQVVPE